MFELVDRVEAYPEFLPWCGGTELLERTDTKTAARIHINYHGLKASFSTQNAKQHPTWMNIELLDGPFRKLEGHWRFIPLGPAQSACKVEFKLQYEFSSRIFEKVLGPVFHHIASTFIESFVKRAGQVYV